MADSMEVTVPDIGDFDEVEVVEVLVAVGDNVAEEASLITLESDKASMEVPSPAAGTVRSLAVSVGDRLAAGAPILTLETTGTAGASPPPQSPEAAPSPEVESAASPEAAPSPEVESAASPEAPPVPAPVTAPPSLPPPPPAAAGTAAPYASPSVRKLARELRLDLRSLAGTGRKGRITREDVRRASQGIGAPAAAAGVLPPMPDIDFSRFGEVERVALTKINRLTGQNLHRSWLHVPHVTQFDEADITELEDFRRASKPEAEARGFKLTFVSFLLAAAAAALRDMPRFNSSLAPGGEELILKKYVNIGVAVDTSRGLVVPVIRDVDRKRVLDLAEELADVSERARAGRLTPADLQGGGFTISSLGGIGGTAFTPIVNAPEVAILGVSRATQQPVWQDGAWVPRLMLPLSLSYDHRVIDGASAARFTTYLARLLSDIRRLVL